MISPNSELFECIKEFCELLLDSNRGDPPYLSVTDEDEHFLTKNERILVRITDDFYRKESRFMMHIADDVFQNHIRKTLNSECFPYLTLSEKNSDTDICKLLADYAQKNMLCFPKCLIAVARHLRTKSVDLENAKIYCGFAYGQKEIERDEKLQLTYQKVQSLYDSIKEDINTLASEQQTRAQRTEKRINSAEKRINSAEKRINKTEKKTIESSITILGIFSAVVLTFNAGVTFSSAALHSFAESTVYRAVLITCIFGIILGNAILGLFAYLEYVRKSSNSTGKISVIKSKTFVVMVVMNLLSVGLIIVDVLCYFGRIHFL